MRVITLAGSPHFPSRSSALLTLCQRALEKRGVEVFPWNLHNFHPEDLLYARFDSPALLALKEDLESADGFIDATPVYKASSFGALKTLLDLLPERALEHKVVLPLATGGTFAQLLAVDYALKPVLHGVIADDTQIAHYDRQHELLPLLAERVAEAVNTFWHALARRHQPLAAAV